MLLGTVQDDAGRVWHVGVRHLAGDEFGATCDCGDGGLCGHALALLFAWAHDSHDFTQAESVPPTEPAETGAHAQWNEILRGSNLTYLRAIARQHGLALNGAERDSNLAQVLNLLADPRRALRALAALSDAQWRLLQMVYLLNDGTNGVSAAELNHSLAWHSVSVVEDELRELRDWGLVVVHPSPGQPTDLYVLAPGVAHGERDASSVSHHSRTASPGLYDVRARHAVDPFTGDLSSLRLSDDQYFLPELMLLAQNLQLTARPMPPEPPQAQGIPALRRWPCVVAELVRLQVQPGWHHQTESTLTVPVPEPRLDARSLERMHVLSREVTLNDFLGRLLDSPSSHVDGASSLRLVFKAWQALATWTELWPVQQRTGLRVRRAVMGSQQTYAGWLQQLARARRFVARVLSLLPADTWFDVGSLLSYIHGIGAEFLHEHTPFAGEPPAWWLEWRGKIVEPGNLESWQASYGMFVAEMLRGPLRWLGVVEVTLAPAKDADVDVTSVAGTAVQAFRITPLGVALLRDDELPVSSRHEQPLQLRDDMSARLVLGRRDLDAYVLLEQSARFERVQDGLAVYRLDSHRMHTAFAQGYTGGEILAELERLAEVPAPEAVRTQLLEWWRSYSEMRWYEGLTLVEMADDYILQELLAQTDLREHLLYTFGPRLVAVRPDSADAFARQLVKKGYTPRIE
jgi:hypothetical protein